MNYITVPAPESNNTRWSDLTPEIRNTVRHWIEAFKKVRICKPITSYFEKLGAEVGVSASTAKNHYYALKNGADWSIFIPNHKLSKPHTECPTNNREFRSYLLELAEGHQRTYTSGINKLWANWRNRKPIPGYENLPNWPKRPAGWGKRNLTRILKEEVNKAALQSIQVGTSSKTNTYLPQVFTTRCGLWPGAVYQIDDVWHDNYVTVGTSGGKKKTARVLELGALDLYSGCRFHWGAKPRLKNDEGKYETLNERDTRFFLAALFNQTGYSSRGTMLMAEWATAAISEHVERILYDETKGLIRVDRQPIEGKQQALTGYWNGTEGGNFRAKAALESIHSKMHNDLAHLPMQTGLNPKRQPVSTQKQLAYIERIMRDVLKKAPENIDRLRLPTLDFHSQFLPLLHDYYNHGLNGRTDHNLEGWQELEFFITEYTAVPGSDQWLSPQQFLALPDASQAIIAENARMHPELWTNQRNLSPMEVWQPAKKNLLTIPDYIVGDILGQDLAEERIVKGSYISFQDQTMPDKNGGEMIYDARYLTKEGVYRPMPHNEKYNVFANPFDPRWLLIYNARHEYLGKCELNKRVNPINESVFSDYNPWSERRDIRSEELREAAIHKKVRTAEIQEATRMRQTERVRDAQDLKAHNEHLIKDGRTPTEIKADANLKRAKTRAEKRTTEAARDVFSDLSDESETIIPDLKF